MRCTSPRTVGFKDDGKTISWSSKSFNKSLSTFQLPCGKCIDCRLEYSRQWAIRCYHESKMHEQNSFITLTYDDDHVGDGRLEYRHFQLFMKKLRKLKNEPIGFFVTGEYGDKTKRPHWHAIVFGWEPADKKYKYSNYRGDRVFSSDTLDKLWKRGITEVGSVTIESAGYCARYAAKKLAHGRDDDHTYHPISKKSSKHAIGKKWLEQYYSDVFNLGAVVLPDGNTCGIPRYYEKWLKEHKPDEWLKFITGVKLDLQQDAQKRSDNERFEWIQRIHSRGIAPIALTPDEVRAEITKQKFEQLQNQLKL